MGPVDGKGINPIEIAGLRCLPLGTLRLAGQDRSAFLPLNWPERPQEQPSYTPDAATAYDLMMVLGTDVRMDIRTHTRTLKNSHSGLVGLT